MKIFIEKDYEAMSQRAFSLFYQFLPEIKVLGLATGNSPLGLYSNICRGFSDGKLSLKNLHTFNLDEYFGIDQKDSGSYRTFMNANLFHKTDVQEDTIHFPNSTGDPLLISEAYNRQIDEIGHPDLQILGIGQNGHLAFNEPGSPRNARTRVVRLTNQTVSVNSPPSKYAVTMGLKDILESKRIILLASGKSKANAVAKMIDGPVGYKVPASYLQEHPEAYVIMDQEASSELNLSEFDNHLDAMDDLGSETYYLDH